MTEYGTLRMLSVEGKGLRCEARFVSHVAMQFDTGAHAVAPSPVESLIGSLAACEGMDVLGILHKKRQALTGYEIVMSGERAHQPPRRFTAIELVHRVTGHGVSEAAVAEAVQLSQQKYCSVYHTLDPNMAITSRVEVLQA
jgi:putative redox protein